MIIGYEVIIQGSQLLQSPSHQVTTLGHYDYRAPSQPSDCHYDYGHRTTRQGSPSAQLHLVITINPYKANFPVEGAAVGTRHRYTSIAILFPV